MNMNLNINLPGQPGGFGRPRVGRNGFGGPRGCRGRGGNPMKRLMRLMLRLMDRMLGGGGNQGGGCPCRGGGAGRGGGFGMSFQATHQVRGFGF